MRCSMVGSLLACLLAFLQCHTSDVQLMVTLIMILFVYVSSYTTDPSIYPCMYVLYVCMIVMIAGLICMGTFSCDWCDLQEIEKLSQLLLDKLAEASLVKYPSMNPWNVFRLKSSLIEAIGLMTVGEEQAWYDYNTIVQRLNGYVQSMSKGMMRAIFGSEAKDSIGHRKTFLSTYFTPYERTELSKLTIRMFDQRFEYHCNRYSCSDTAQAGSSAISCIFIHETCPNGICGFRASHKQQIVHAEQCIHKVSYQYVTLRYVTRQSRLNYDFICLSIYPLSLVL